MPRRMFVPEDAEPKRKASRVPAPPGRRGRAGDVAPAGSGVDEDEGDAAGCIYVRGPDDFGPEIEYQVRAQTGTTAGAGKRIKGLGTTLGLPLDEPRHGEVVDVEREGLEGAQDVSGGSARRKAQVTE